MTYKQNSGGFLVAMLALGGIILGVLVTVVDVDKSEKPSPTPIAVLLLQPDEPNKRLATMLGERGMVAESARCFMPDPDLAQWVCMGDLVGGGSFQAILTWDMGDWRLIELVVKIP